MQPKEQSAPSVVPEPSTTAVPAKPAVATPAVPAKPVVATPKNPVPISTQAKP